MKIAMRKEERKNLDNSAKIRSFKLGTIFSYTNDNRTIVDGIYIKFSGSTSICCMRIDEGPYFGCTFSDGCFWGIVTEKPNAILLVDGVPQCNSNECDCEDKLKYLQSV